MAFGGPGKPPVIREFRRIGCVGQPNMLPRAALGRSHLGCTSCSFRATTEDKALRLELIVPVVMSCAVLWWVSRGMSWSTRLLVTAVTLGIIVCIILFERSGMF
jgi:hypothetical protein